MPSIQNFLGCLFSPRLYRIYEARQSDDYYKPGGLEKWGDFIVTTFQSVWNLGFYIYPAIALIIYKKGLLGPDPTLFVAKLAAGTGLLLTVAVCIRSYGRVSSPKYMNFYQILLSAQQNLTEHNKKSLLHYDFDFSGWPIEFSWRDAEKDDASKSLSEDWKNEGFYGLLGKTLDGPFSMLIYVVSHAFAISIVYPGSMSFINYVMNSNLSDGRKKLIVTEMGERFKIHTRDGNDLDTMFVDRRGKTHLGKTLVICSEGNAGFYEVGIMVTPLDSGYSVLGWNHPGFGASTGTPYPDQEQKAIDCVIQFAVHHLKFEISDIILFGWSIGGYVSSYAASRYQDFNATVIDASFDDILPLAIPRMPSFLSFIVSRVMRENINLTPGELIKQYKGPVFLFRRSDDEIIAINPGSILTNRGNDLLKCILSSRFPALMNNFTEPELDNWLSKSVNTLKDVHNDVKDAQCESILSEYIEQHGKSYPMSIGETMDVASKSQLLLYLAKRHMADYKSTHCPPLPARMFQKALNTVIID
nr:PREDICTED: protein ABHD16A [Bemisia tabaci]